MKTHKKRLATSQRWRRSVRGRPCLAWSACGAERFFGCLWCAQTTRAMFAHAGAQSIFLASKHARACVARALRATSAHVLDKPHFITMTATAIVAKCKACRPLHVTMQPASRGRELQGFSDPGVMRKRKVQSRRSIATTVREALCTRGSVEKSACCNLRGGASAARPMLCTLFRKTALESVSLVARRCTACFDTLDPQLCCQRLLRCHDPRQNGVKLLQGASRERKNSQAPHSRAQN